MDSIVGKATSVAGFCVSRLAGLTLAAASVGCTVFGVETVEEASFQSVTKQDSFEVRDYAALIVAQTEITGEYRRAGNVAFRRLFGYISGDNELQQEISMTAPVVAQSDSQSEKIEMTAPVVSQKSGESWLYQFVLPAEYTIDNTPAPTNKDVSIVVIPERRVATLQYAGRSTDKARIQNTERLIRWLEIEGYTAISEPRWAGYNAPWTLPMFRRNEVLIDINKN